jgi:hypothetical protein
MGQTQGGSGNGDFGGETNGASAGGGNPWQKLLMGGLKGGLSGYSDMQKQNQMMRQGSPQMPVPMPQQPQVQLPIGLPPQRRGPNDLNFYGGQ